MKRWYRGFSLIEMLLAISILASLGYVAIPTIQSMSIRFQEKELRIALRTIRNALDAYRDAVEQGRVDSIYSQLGYPISLNDLSVGLMDMKDSYGRVIYFLRHIPRDPFYPDNSVTPAETWGIRCYESSAEHPIDGPGVFDVYSLSNSVGLNGIAYREW